MRLPAAPFMGVMGSHRRGSCSSAPGRAEQRAAAEGGLVELPNSTSAVPPDLPGDPATRTISPTEAGGNIDIKHLTAGSRVYLPVWVAGALFSVGDGHFAQGDGESCGAAVETTTRVVLRFDLRKQSATSGGARYLRFERLTAGPPEVAARPHFAVTGVPVDDAGRIHPENLNLATRNALRLMVDHLANERGFTRQQAYAPVQRGRRPAHQPNRRCAKRAGVGYRTHRYLRVSLSRTTFGQLSGPASSPAPVSDHA